MSIIQNSENFIWDTSSVLGSGSFGSVYKGEDKTTGEDVAVKVFGRNLSKYALDLQIREFEVMKTLLHHKNIVKVLAIEHELQFCSKVLVMELCRGGNLQKILNDPKNIYGLEEEEFLCVLKDMFAGLKYMRENNIVHRDIKPSNILKYIADNGCTIYKLADFGAARYLEDDQEFQSIHGTPEYLHPDLLERAIYTRGDKRFDSTVDLWSIGATIYQLATGSLPFQPYGGRTRQKAMLCVISKKPPGAIAGIQYGPGPESIKWFTELPQTCLLNQKLRSSITVVLAGTLETNKEKVWTYNKFFEYVGDIVTAKVFHLFYMNEGKEVSLFMHPDKKLQDLQKEIFKDLQVPLSSQVLLFNDISISSLIDIESNVSTFPTTTADKPLILMRKLLENDQIQVETFHNWILKLMPSRECDIVRHASQIKKCCYELYALKRVVEKLARCQDHVLKFPKILISSVVKDVSKMCSDCDILMLKAKDLNQRCKLFDKFSSAILQFISMVNVKDSDSSSESVQIVCDEIRKMSEEMKKEEVFSSISKLSNSIKQRSVISKSLLCSWDHELSDLSCLVECVQKANTYIERIHESLTILLKINPQNGSIQSDKLLHLKLVKVQFYYKELVALSDKCLHVCLKTFQKVAEWYCGVEAFMVQCRFLVKDLTSASNDFKTLSSSLSESESKLFHLAKEAMAAFSTPDLNKKRISNANACNIDFMKAVNLNTCTEDNVKQYEDIVSKLLEDFGKGQLDLKVTIEENLSLTESFVKIFQVMKKEVFEESHNPEEDSSELSHC